jgi:hypothetical protein
MNRLFKFIFVTCLLSFSIEAQIYVSPDGDDTNSGTLDFPLKNISTAISKAQAGDTIYVRGGIYSLSVKISISKNGNENTKYHFFAYNGEKPILDFSSMPINSSNRGINLSGDYWYVKGIEIKGAGDNGMNVSGSNNIVEFCSFYENHDTGLQLSSGASNNQIINCDSYFNADPGQGNADGFAPKLDVGTNNYFYGCRAWQNSDDGWDGYMRGSNDVSTTLENCWCFMNGYLKDGSASTGNGNGFKMGGSDDKTLMHNFTLINCVAFENRVKGFDQNNNKGSMTLYNCMGHINGTNYSIPSALNSGKTATVINSISLGSSDSFGDFVVQQTNSWQSPFVVNKHDFISIDTLGVRGSRNADGSLPDINFLHLVEGSDLIDAGTNVGLPFNGTAPDLGAFETSSVIPVELVSFKASIFNNSILLMWVTSTELNNRGFEVQKKLNENDFAAIGFVNGTGTAAEKSEYFFTDRNLFQGLNIYRLKQVDYSGIFIYSNEIQINLNIPEEFTLYQNYPNPFNPSTTIKYQIDAPGDVVLQIFNHLGEKVSELVHDYQDAGSYEVDWFARSEKNEPLASGIYIARLSANEHSAMIKISVIK